MGFLRIEWLEAEHFLYIMGCIYMALMEIVTETDITTYNLNIVGLDTR